jgi:hypothetical protein
MFPRDYFAADFFSTDYWFGDGDGAPVEEEAAEEIGGFGEWTPFVFKDWRRLQREDEEWIMLNT